MAVYVIFAIAILTQLILSRGFLLDGLSDVVTVSTSVGEIVGKLETSEFDGKQQTVKVFSLALCILGKKNKMSEDILKYFLFFTENSF